MAPAHMAQGSSVTYSVVPISRSLPRRAAPARSTSISAWAVGSRVGDDAVAVLGEHLALGRNQHRADGDFAP